MAITAAEVNKLRKATGAGMMDCKKALEEANGDFEAAVDILRKKGQKVSAKRAEREATEGLVIAQTSSDSTKGVVVAINCETDFVAKNEDFRKFAESIANVALEKFPSNLENLLNEKINGQTIAQSIEQQVGKIGEKIDLSSYENVEGDEVVSYNHLGNKIGVLVAFNKKGERIEEAGRDIAMQIAAMNPLALNKDGISQDIIDRELEIAKEQIKAEGKPENMIEKIATGKLNKFFKENTLLEQQFVKDSSQSVKNFLTGVDKDLVVISFKRISIGDA